MLRSVFVGCLIGLAVGQGCRSVPRGKVQWYYDPLEWTCFAYPADCNVSFQVKHYLYDTEEECTLLNMVRLWKSYQLACGPFQRLVTYNRSNGDKVPYIFSSKLCTGSASEICNTDEYCHSHRGFAYCCNAVAYKGDGPVSGTFNFTALGGSPYYITNKVVTSPPVKAPQDCNLDGNRQEIEWYPQPGMACLSRRKVCSTPAFGRNSTAVTYKTQQECMDEHFPNLKMSYKLTCSNGYSAAKADAAIVFSKDKCASMHHSDMCNYDEYCAFKASSPYAFCCARSEEYPIVSYAIYGKFFRRRNRRSIEVDVQI